MDKGDTAPDFPARTGSAAIPPLRVSHTAPNWRRLHLKWGQALVYAGKKTEAHGHFARASLLDLTPSEKSELAQSLQLAAT